MDNSLIGIEGNLGRPGTLSKKTHGRLRHQNVGKSSHSSGGSSSSSDSALDASSSLFSDPYDEDRLSYVEGDLSEYYIPPSQMKKVLRKYRRFSDIINTDLSLAEFEKEEDEHKAFALFEMRSRIMEMDIERGLERRGGTLPVDDMVTTGYYRTSHRIRDAVIVAKAWRDGANPSDVIKTALLTRRQERTHFVKRKEKDGYVWWEPATWADDTDFALYRCPSLGPRQLRGFEMFTIGDCQSILLKLSNERCLVCIGQTIVCLE